MKMKGIYSSKNEIIKFCKKNGIGKLLLFCSALRGELTKESDIDFIVEFSKKKEVSFFDLVQMEEDLQRILKRKVIKIIRIKAQFLFSY